MNVNTLNIAYKITVRMNLPAGDQRSAYRIDSVSAREYRWENEWLRRESAGRSPRSPRHGWYTPDRVTVSQVSVTDYRQMECDLTFVTVKTIKQQQQLDVELFMK